MKLEWSPETASKAFIDTVKSCENFNEFGVAELLSATAAGWNAKLIAEAWSPGGPIATSVGLSIAAKHTGGKHLCIVTDERSRTEYIKSMKASGATPVPEVSISNLDEGMSKLEGIDFLVVDCKRRDFARVLREVKAGNSGAVFVCKNASERNNSSFRWNGVLRRGTRIVRTEFLPVGKGLEIAHIGSSSGGNSTTSRKTPRRWIKHVDQLSGEEHFFREPLAHPRSRV